MSWIFALLLSMYAVVRGTFWVRGQLRYLAVRRELPPLPNGSRERPPRHLPEGLVSIWRETIELRNFVLTARRTIAIVRVTDPDSPLGVVRDPRYRRAVIECRNRMRRWLRRIESLPTHERHELDSFGGQSVLLGGGVATLDEAYRKVSRARALEPFPVTELERMMQTLEAVGASLERVRERLSEPELHGYRPLLSDAATSGVFAG